MSSAFADPRDRDYRTDEVRDIQERLVELRLVDRGFEVDGVYGSGTREAVRDFQRDHNISPADGEAGPRTVDALFGEGDKGAPQQQARGRCKSEEISSTGNARPIESWALKLAKKNWREEVRARYGEEWSDYNNAQVSLSKCFESSVGGVPLKRCRIVATPCNPI
ncbi:peptidoglycan-binding domain-containing protein [Rhodomicrobium sp. R_RK_3]|uniref:peptidoglycan-binding domain-containing protein n=1 Tax=Rhodomicrobium sp. R_RK_3 TaxID=2029567 RepID=UPI001AECD313|nr:peptidoglycan-binding domain-containing protein [Rhodomicrobium sp. R_RK_3]